MHDQVAANLRTSSMTTMLYLTCHNLVFAQVRFESLIVLQMFMQPVPNQELSGAKSELQGETVGLCSSYRRGGQPPYN